MQFGIVFRAQYFLDDGTEDMCAVKMLRKGTPQEDFLSFLREAETMTQLQHPNIVTLRAVCLNEQPWLLVQELMMYAACLHVQIACLLTSTKSCLTPC